MRAHHRNTTSRKLIVVALAAALASSASASPTGNGTEHPDAVLQDQQAAPAAQLHEDGFVWRQQASDSQWRLRVAPRMWVADIEIGTPAADVDISFSDIMDNLDLTLMGTLWVDKDGTQWGGMFDTVYLDLEKGSGELQASIMTAMISYRPVADAPHKLLAGVRYWDETLTAGPLGANVDWVDPLLGAATSYAFNDKFSAGLYGDLGGFGIGDASHFTWQAMGALEYRFNDIVAINGGYRYLRADQRETVDADTKIKGPIFGLILTL